MTLTPTRRLLFLFGTIFLPLTIIHAVFPAAGLVLYGVTGIFIFVAVLDCMETPTAFEGVQLKSLGVVRISQGKSSEIELEISNSLSKKGRLRIGLSFPQNLFSENQDLFVTLPLNNETEFFKWPVKGLKKGHYFLENCRVEKESFLKLWHTRKELPVNCEIRVYPNLFSEKKLLAQFMVFNTGSHISRQMGKGREFEKLREYIPGDSYEDIHWKATAKRSMPITKIFQVERTQDINIIIDSSRLSGRNAHIFNKGRVHDEKRSSTENEESMPQETILDRYITASLMIGKAAEKYGDNFGLTVFSDKVRRFVKPRGGKSNFNVCSDMLYDINPQRVTPDFQELVTFTATRIRKRSLLIIMTNLDDPVLAEDFLKHIHILIRRHLVVVNMLKPAAATPIFSNPEISSVNGIYQDLGGHMAWNRLREIERSLSRHGIGLLLLENQQLCSQLITNYMDIKQRQIL